ncbi:MAG: hypothetical protein ACI9P7_000651 [Candidatus Azotimanducaceae bacterium]|jgi:hypothetical protein
MHEVLASTHDVTKEWLTEMLKINGGLKSEVASVELITIGEGVGLMGELGRLTLTYTGQEDLPATMVIKCAAQNENINVARVLDFYNREVNFYNRVGTNSGLRIPGSYYGAVDQATYNCTILMQDLGDVSPNDQIVGATEAEAFAAIEKISVLHGRYWGQVRNPENEWMYDVMGEESSATLRDLVYMPAVESCIENFDSFFDDEARELVRAVGKNFPDYWRNKVSPAETFIHGDYRQDNFLYVDGDPNAVVMDWQISGSGRGIFDFTYFVCQSLTSERRLQIEKALLKTYVDGLKAAGVEDYDFETALLDYRTMILGCLVYPITVGGSLDLSNDRGKALAECMLSRNLAAIKELNCAELL